MQKKRLLALFCVTVVMFSGSGSAADVNSTMNTTPLPDYSNIYVQVANDEGVSFNTTGNGTYYIQSLSAPNGGFNAVHIANDSSAITNYGGSTNTTNQSGTFYATDTGGRGYQDDVVLMLAVGGTIPDDFAVTLTANGYNWTPTGTMNDCPVLSEVSYGTTLNETFTKSDFLYGAQNWKPTGGNDNYPIYIGEDMNDTSNMFYIMFIDLHAGLLGCNYKSGSNSQFINNGAVEINYTFTNLQSLAAFNIYAWNYNTSQGQGMLWTNSILPGNTGGPSGYTVMGSSNPIADFSTNVTSGVVPLTVQFTDKSTGAKPLTYNWDFGDGTTSTEQNPTHTYSTTGNYTVTLNVNNSCGSAQKTSTIIVNLLEVLADLQSGLYNTTKTVNLTANDQQDPNPQIYYTLDGSDPTTSSTLYSGPINITNEGTTVLKFRAFDIYGYTSDIFTRIYNVDMTSPTVSATPSEGTYYTTQNVNLKTTDANSATTYYTMDNTDPRSSKTRTVYSNPIELHNSTLLQFAALDAAGNWSPLYSQNYTLVDLTSPVASVDLSSGNYTTDQVVKLGAVDELDDDPQIYYTLDGTDPTTNSTLYTWPISINIVGTTVLKVIAVDYSGHISDVLTRIYSLDKPASSGTWNSTVLDSDVIYNSIVLDDSNYPHIAYYQTAKSGTDYPDLKYAYEDASGWHVETVDSVPPGSGYYVSLALDSSGNPHIVYKQQFGDNYVNMLKYAFKDASGWHVSILTTSYPENTIGDDILYCNLVLYHDQPRISFYNFTGGQLEYMYKNGTSWITEIVTSNGGPWNSLALDSSGNPKISYYSVSSSSGLTSLRYAQRTSTGIWQITIVDNSADDVGAWNSLALDSSGNPSISYIYNDGSLRYAYWNGTQWISETVDSTASSSCKMVLNPSNSPIIIYRDSTSSNLKYAYKEGSNWVIHNIDAVNGAALWDSLTLNSEGVPYVSYETKTSYLKYAYLIPFNASADPSGGTFNQTQTVELTSTSGTTLYYTTDGSDPRTSSTRTVYSNPITVKNTTTLRFAAVDSADNWGSIYSETYLIVRPVTNTHTNMNYDTIQEAINDLNTTDGDTLTVASGNYAENVNLNKSLILKALGSVNITPLNSPLPVFTITAEGSGSTITGFTISGSSFGIYLSYASNCNVTNNTLSNNTYGLLMEYSVYNNITGNKVINNTNSGLVSRYWSKNNIISNNTIQSNGYGLHLLYAYNNTITSNYVSNNTFYGIYADNSQNNILLNNTVTGNPYSGIALYFGADNNTITSNSFINNGFGLYSYQSNKNFINKNDLSNNSYYGVYMDNSTENKMLNNTVTGNPYAGLAMYFTSNNNTLANNTISGDGFGVYSYSSNGNTMNGNEISGNSAYGIYLDSSSQNTIKGNNITGNPYTGIALYFGSDWNSILNNTLTANGFGIYSYESNNNTVAANNISRNSFYGVYLDNSSQNSLTGNTLNNNSYAGLAVYNTSNANSVTGNNIGSNQFGVYVDNSSENSFYTNNFTENNVQAYDNGSNSWDDGNTGNYYNDWQVTAIRPVDGGSNVDNHPSKTTF
jgi:parallel beta-helix repeat protein